MTITLEPINNDDRQSKTKEFTNPDNGLVITVRSFYNDQYQKAWNLLNIRANAQSKQIIDAPLDDSFFDDHVNDAKTADDMLPHAIAKYLVTDWNVADKDGAKLPITGENMTQLILKLGIGVIGWIQDCAFQVEKEIIEQREAVKKKPSSAGSGKKIVKD